jgi:hypothetical protein
MFMTQNTHTDNKPLFDEICDAKSWFSLLNAELAEGTLQKQFNA